MVDINSSFLIQIVNFLVLLVALHFILFKPIRAIMQERSQSISGSYTDAKTAQEKIQSLTDRYTAALAEAKQRSNAAYGALYQQGLDVQRDLISQERTRAGEQLDKARADIAAASAAARNELKAEAERLSKDIAGKMLGRAV